MIEPNESNNFEDIKLDGSRKGCVDSLLIEDDEMVMVFLMTLYPFHRKPLLTL